MSKIDRTSGKSSRFRAFAKHSGPNDLLDNAKSHEKGVKKIEPDSESIRVPTPVDLTPEAFGVARGSPDKRIAG